jgi:hypothetical protein
VKKDPCVYMAHSLECAAKIERYTKGGKEQFLNDEMVQDAVIRNFEIIGEAAKRVPTGYRRAHAEMPWRLMAGFSRCVNPRLRRSRSGSRVAHRAGRPSQGQRGNRQNSAVARRIGKAIGGVRRRQEIEEMNANWGPTRASCLSEHSDQQNGAFFQALFSRTSKSTSQSRTWSSETS